MITRFKITAIAGAAALGIAVGTPAQAAELPISANNNVHAHSAFDSAQTWDHKRKRHKHRHARGHAYGHDRAYYGEPVHRRTRVWRGRDGRYYCRRDDGTTGLLIGAAVGGLIGHEIAGYGDRTLGAILGAAGGALLGRAIDRSEMRCR